MSWDERDIQAIKWQNSRKELIIKNVYNTSVGRKTEEQKEQQTFALKQRSTTLCLRAKGPINLCFGPKSQEQHQLRIQE